MRRMNEQILFDRLRYVDKLKSTGIPEPQARAYADAMHEALRDSALTVRLFEQRLLALEQRLTINGGLIAAAVVAILAGIKYFG